MFGDSTSQYLLKVTFNRLINFNPEKSKLVFHAKKEDGTLETELSLSRFSFEKTGANRSGNHVSLLFSFKEFPVLIIGSIWMNGRIILTPRNYLLPTTIPIDYGLGDGRKIIKRCTIFSEPRFLKEPWNELYPGLWDMNVFKIKINGTLYILPVYEAIRAFYCESTSIAYSCFNGKSIFNRALTEHARQFYNIKEEEGFVVLEKHIEDDRAALAFRLIENDRYYLEFCKVFQTILDKENNGPLINFPIDWKTELTFYGTKLYNGSVFINYIDNYTDYQSKFRSAQFGRVNDGRKGENSESEDLIKTYKPKRRKPKGDLGDYPVVDDVKIDIELENSEIYQEVLNIPQSNLQIKKVEKTIQFYSNEGAGITISDGDIKSITTSDEYTDGSLAGGLHLNGDTRFFESSFKDLLSSLEDLINTAFSLTPRKLQHSKGDYVFLPKKAIDKPELYRWCFLKKNNGVYSAVNRKIGIFKFEYNNYFCYVFEVEHRLTERRSAIGIGISKVDLSKEENSIIIGKFMQAIKLRLGKIEKIPQDYLKDFLFDSQRHLSDFESLCNHFKTKVEGLIKIGV